MPGPPTAPDKIVLTEVEEEPVMHIKETVSAESLREELIASLAEALFMSPDEVEVDKPRRFVWRGHQELPVGRVPVFFLAVMLIWVFWRFRVPRISISLPDRLMAYWSPLKLGGRDR